MDARRVAALRPFADLSPAQHGMLARMLDEVRAPAGATLVSEGDYGYEFMVIEEGTVDVFRGGERVDEMGPGDFFGELAVLGDGAQRNATIVATSPVRLLTLTAHYMREVRERMPSVGEQIDRVISERTPASSEA
jgi:CRP/FNR family transcriptional regulator, cyclic AMP receptor protein